MSTPINFHLNIESPQPGKQSTTILSRATLCVAAILWTAATTSAQSGSHRSRVSVARNNDVRINDADASYPIILSDVRSIDGADSSGQSAWGISFIRLLRVAPAEYPGDGSGDEIISAPVRANPRTISNVIAAQDGVSIVNDRNMSDYVWAFGQFVDHDIDLTPSSPDYGTADVEIEDEDDPLGPGTILFDRSAFDPSTGTAGAPRQQLNQITAFIDASTVYGSDNVRAAAVRTFEGGRLKTSAGDLLPFNVDGLPNAGGPSDTLFLAGDVRTNENLALTSVHTIFMREHNRLARLISLLSPQSSDEDIYQVVRKVVSAEVQLITYSEFLPALLGPEAPAPSEGQYDPSVNPLIANEFSTAIYRMGHSLLSANLVLADEGRGVGRLPLRNAYFNPDFLVDAPGNIDRLLEGLSQQPCQEVDTRIVDDVRNFLFGPPGAGGLDLATLNIQRGRDHGLADFNTTRAAFGLSRLHDIQDMTSDVSTQVALDLLYGSVDNIDLWVGALAEDHVAGASVGPTMAVAIHDQFARLLAGDRFSVLSDTDLDQPLIQSIIPLAGRTLADVVRANTSVETLPDNVMFVSPGATYDVTAAYDSIANRVYVTGNRSNNNVLVSETKQGFLVMGRKGSRINGKQAILFDTSPRPSVTIDLGAGDNSITFVNCHLSEVIVSTDDGDDYLRTVESSAGTSFCDLGSGNNVVRWNSGFAQE